MRTATYAIFHKGTNQRVYTNCSYTKCVAKLQTLDNEGEYEIRHKWHSI